MSQLASRQSQRGVEAQSKVPKTEPLWLTMAPMGTQGWQETIDSQAFLERTKGTPCGADSEYESLSVAPAEYPGRFIEESYVYRRGYFWTLSLPPNERLTRARIPARGHDDRPRQVPLTNQLLRWGSTELTRRVPVVAIGSNAYPRQLFDKLHREYVDDAIPSIVGRLTNTEIVFCPYVAKDKGYVPVTPTSAPGATSRATLQLLTTGQLAQIMKTESNYQFVRFTGGGTVFEADGSNEVISDFYLFWYPSVLGWGGAPAICAGTLLSTADPMRLHRELSERQLMEQLNITQTDESRSVVTARLQSLQLPNPRPVGCVVVETQDQLVQYGEINSHFAGKDVAEDSLRVKRTGPNRVDAGNQEILAYLHAEDIRSLGLGSRAVAFKWRIDGAGPNPRRMLAVPVRIIDGINHSLGVERGELALDQMGRTAIAVSPGEFCRLAPLREPFSAAWRRVIGRVFKPRTVAGRAVQAAETVMERPICWVEETVLRAIGLDEGGYAIVTGVEWNGSDQRPAFSLSTHRLQVLAPTGRHIHERVGVLQADDPDARYPDPGEVLGVFPDIPWVWIDWQARTQIGLSKMHPLSPILIQPSISYLFIRTFSRFVLATLGIGVSLSLAAYRALESTLPSHVVGGLLPVADVVAFGILVAFSLGALVVIVLSGRRSEP